MPSVFSFVENSVQNALLRVEKHFHEVALGALERQVELGNTVYSTMVDGRPVSGKDQVYRAKKSIRFNFPLQAVEVAIRVMQNALQTEIGARATETGRMKASVRVWHGGDGKPPVEVTGVTAIEDFAVGDYIMLVPDVYYFAFSNSRVKDRTGQGFMARAAARIRRAIKVTKKTAGLSIYVGRSRAVENIMNIPVNKSKTPRKRLHPAKNPLAGKSGIGVPVIYIKWKSNQFQVLGA